MNPPLLKLAHQAVRARREWMLGGEGPYFGRFALGDLPTPDLAEHGAAALRVWALWSQAERLDAGLAHLRAVRVDAQGTSYGVDEALEEVAHEQDLETADSLLRAVARVAAPAALRLGGVFGRMADRLGERGVTAFVSPAELAAAQALLAASEEPVRDVLGWAVRGFGRSTRTRPTLASVLRALRNPRLDRVLQPIGDPLPTVGRWRASIGVGSQAGLEIAPSGWLGSWVLRGKAQRLLGIAAWPGALRWRFALQGFGRLDALAESGRAALLPRDAAAADLLGALYPLWLVDPEFQRRSLKFEDADRDTGRLAALGEILLQRTQAGVVQLWGAFDQGRALGAVLETPGGLSGALQTKVAPELGLLLAAPWGGGVSAPPRAILAAATLTEELRETLDQDFWRNPRLGERLRGLANRAAGEPLEALVPEAVDLQRAAYGRWVETALGA